MIEGTKAALKAQVTTRPGKGNQRVGRSILAGLSALAAAVAAAQEARGASIPWAALPEAIGPLAALGVLGAIGSAWWTTDRADPEESES